MRLLMDIVGDPARLAVLMQQLEQRDRGSPARSAVGAFLNICAASRSTSPGTNPASSIRRCGRSASAAGRLSAEAMLELLLRRAKPEAMAGLRRRRQRDGAPHERLVGRAVSSPTP